MTGSQNTFVVIGCNHHRAPLAVRECFNLGGDQVEELYRALEASDIFTECLVLNTCNRIEVYGICNPDQAATVVQNCLCSLTGANPDDFQSLHFAQHDRTALSHLFDVAAGIDSQIIGETEILGQVKAAYAYASGRNCLGKNLHLVFQKAFQAAKHVRATTSISTGQVSLGNVAVDLAARIFGDLSPSRVLVVGSGDVGRDVAKAFRSRGVRSIAVSGRTTERARDLAAAIEGTVLPFEVWPDQMHRFDVVIFATAAPGAVLQQTRLKTTLELRNNQPLFLIDLAVPRDVESACGDLADVFLYNIDDLAAIANENKAARTAEIDLCRTLLQKRVDGLMLRLKI